MAYNLTALQASDTVLDLIVVANDATGQLMVGAFMIAFYFVMLMSLKKAGFQESFVTASFVGFVFSYFLMQAELINFYFVIGFLTVTAFSVLVLYMRKK